MNFLFLFSKVTLPHGPNINKKPCIYCVKAMIMVLNDKDFTNV